MAAGDAFGASLGATGRPQDNSISLQLPAIPLWLPEQARRELSQLVRSSLHLALQDAAGFISDETPRSEGLLAQSFGADPANQSGGIELTGQDITTGFEGRVFSTLPYAIVMNEGRRPGAPISRAGIEAIGLWCQRKLGLSADQAAEAKWAIAASIVAQGIQGTGYFDTGVDKVRPRIEAVFQHLADQIAAALTGSRGGTGAA